MSESKIPHLNKPIVKYMGEDITCYPSSNATDNGKLNLEFNMARFVTRLSSKNFCIVKPSFDLELVTDTTTKEQIIRVGTGQASINGMDLIMTNTVTIEPPDKPGHYHLAFHLERDSSNNVEGDTVYGVSTIFGGISLRYYTEKPDPVPDMDMLYLGNLDWDGTEFSNIKEDEDKYGRIWAEDVLGKFEDPKHPDIIRMNLQELIYKLPDWYFSKEGDTVYGPIILADDRFKNNPGIILNVDNKGSHIAIKDPTVDNDKLQFYGDVNQDGVINEDDLQLVKDIISGKVKPNELQKVLADVNHDGLIDEKDVTYITNFISGNGNAGDTGNIYYITRDDSNKGIYFDITEGKSNLKIEKANIYEDEKDDILHIHNEGAICIDGEGPVTIEGDGKISLSTENANSPVLNITDNNISIVDPDAEDLEFKVEYKDQNTVQQTLGQAIWQYDKLTKNVTLLQDNVEYLDVVPNGVFEQDLTVEDTLHIGPLLNDQTYLKQTAWQIANRNKSKITKWTPNTMIMTNTTLSDTDNSYILLKNSQNTIHTQIFDNGKIELLNSGTTPKIVWKDGTAAYDTVLEKIKGEKRLNIQGNLTVTNNITASGLITGNGLKTSNGVLTFSRGSNDATITKDNDSNNLRTSNNLYVGTSGQAQLFAGNTVINGSMGIGGSTYENSELKVDASGNLDTSGTIRGAKVFNAVYNDTVEFMEKADYNEIIEAGDVVYFNKEGKVTKYNENIDTKALAGVVSSEETYGYALGGDGLEDNQKIPVALTGRVYLKVENLSVETGDILSVNSCGEIIITESLNRYTLGKATTYNKNGYVYIKVI